MKRVYSGLLLLVILLGMMLPLPNIMLGVHVAEAQGVYVVPITVVNNVGKDLINYSLKIELNYTNFEYLEHIASHNGSDIYFLDSQRNPLYYWIESATNVSVMTPIPRGDQNPGVYWRYTTSTPPSNNWYDPSFDDSSWSEGEVPIGDTGPYRTNLDFEHLYARKKFTIPSSLNGISVVSVKYAELRIASDDGADAWVNGVQVLADSSSTHGYSYWDYVINVTQYVQIGDNVVAIHVYDGGGGNNYMDAELYVELEYDSLIEVTVYVKVPFIPANNTTTIYMYYGGDNPYAEYNNVSKVFILYTHFDEPTLPPGTETKVEIVPSSNSGTATYTITNSYLELAAQVPDSGGSAYIDWVINKTLLGDLVIETKVWAEGYANWETESHAYIILSVQAADGNNGTYIYQLRCAWNDDLCPTGNYSIPGITGSSSGSGEDGMIPESTWTELTLYPNIDFPNIGAPQIEKVWYIAFEAFAGQSWAPQDDAAHTLRVDYVRIRYYVSPEPSVIIGSEVLASAIMLPSNSMYLVHDIIYSPNSTQFSHSFTAVNTTTAGYEVNYTDAYGWRVYAEPYEVNGTYYENNASLVSEVSIVLPYSGVLVENVTLYARANGTGAYRQLWVKVLDSAAGVVAELVNATIGTDWTEVVLEVNTTLSNQLTIWINATVGSTNGTGEAIAVRDVRLYASYSVSPYVYLEALLPNQPYFRCSAEHDVELGSTDYINSSVITFKLIQYLVYDSVEYPVQPVYVGNETIGSYNYTVYRIMPANYSQTLKIYALLENRIKTFRTHVRGFDTETVIIGETLTVELPEVANITIPELNKTFINVSAITLRFTKVGTFTISANISMPMLWRFGCARKVITVKYGAFLVRALDVDLREIDYETLRLQLLNKTDGSVIKELVGNKLFTLDGLWAGNYSIRVLFKDIVVAEDSFELNASTDGSTVDLLSTMKLLGKDYRGLNRTVVYGLGKQLVGIESLSPKYPYSRMRVLLNGSGSFKVYINYGGDLPSKVSVDGNVTDLKYYWDDNYLVISGILGSVGELNITDLYKVRLEAYDRLGNRMPSWIYLYINGTKYSGAVVEDYYYPENYVIELPKTINGFEFYSFFDGYNETVRAVALNNTDVTYKVWYRVPTSFTGVKGTQITVLKWMPFISQDSEMVKVYIEGYIVDYYGFGVPNRSLTINITDVEAGFTWTINATADATGYFKSQLLELVRGRTYRIDIVYSGDDIYVGSSSTMEIKPEELPTAPTVVYEFPIEYIIVTVAVILIIIGIAAALRAVRHSIEDLHTKARKFVKKKY